LPNKKILRISLLEDDVDQANRVAGWISEKGYQCEVFHQPEEFQRAFRKTSFDVVALDWNLPNATGLEILNWIRHSLISDVPIIFISARQSEFDIVTALEAGADDFLVKPVRKFELIARLGALAKRGQPETEVLKYGPYTFDTNSRQLSIRGESVHTTDKEYDMALFLFRNRGRVLSRHHLLTSVWGTAAELNTRTVDTHASRLRKKLKLSATEEWKLTAVYQHGYRLEEYNISGETKH